MGEISWVGTSGPERMDQIVAGIRFTCALETAKGYLDCERECDTCQCHVSQTLLCISSVFAHVAYREDKTYMLRYIHSIGIKTPIQSNHLSMDFTTSLDPTRSLLP